MTPDPNGLPTQAEAFDSPHYESAESAARFYQSIGPWVTTKAVMDSCHVTEEMLRAWRETNVVVGVQFNDGNYYYPTLQFRDGRPAAGLPEVLAALAPGYVSTASRVAWFAGHAYVGGEETRWDLLHRGQTDLLVSWAEEDVARITGP